MSRPAQIDTRLLTASEAAAYFRLSVKAFERLNVGRVSFGTRVLYDRKALDAHLDRISGVAQPGLAPHDNDDAEAALDRFTAGSRHTSGRP